MDKIVQVAVKIVLSIEPVRSRKKRLTRSLMKLSIASTNRFSASYKHLNKITVNMLFS
jgi:hypothetical protein